MEWKEAMYKRLTEDEIADKRWQIKLSLLSHTPMTGDAAKATESELREIERTFSGILRAFDGRPAVDEPLVSNYKVHLAPGESLGYSL